MTYGGRGQIWLNDHIAIGASKVIDERDAMDYDLTGVDVTLRATKGSYVKLEGARSEARQTDANFLSVDGGLSFRSQTPATPGAQLEGEAFAIEGRLDLTDVSKSMNGDVRVWHKDRDDEFSTGRLGQGADITDTGVEFEIDADNVTLTGGFTKLEEEGISEQRIARVQADFRINRLAIGAEVRHEDIERGTRSGEALLVGARVGYDVTDNSTVYGSVQTVADDKGDYEDNDLVAIGVNTQVSENLAVSLEASDGDRGSALIAGLDMTTRSGARFSIASGVGSGAVSEFAGTYDIAEGHSLYGSYAVDPDRTEGDRNLLTFGQRRDMGNSLSIFTESQFGKGDRYDSLTHAFGIDFDGIENWVLSSDLQYSDNDDGFQMFERWAGSLGASMKKENMQYSTRFEYREDEGPDLHTIQYLTSNSLSYKVNDSHRWLGQLNLSWTDDELNGGKDARFVEFDIGHAYRPFKHDRFNMISKYSYFIDLTSEGQIDPRPDQRVHILATEGLYQLNHRIELGAKFAIKEGKMRIERDSGRWFSYGARLAALRGRYHVTKKWDALAEYRWLSDNRGDSTRHGALIGVYRHIGDNLKVGAGYNFTDFSDDLKDADYDNQGWFIDLIGKF